MEKRDLLQRDRFIENTKRYIQILLEDANGASIAIDGKWGCGKTFVVNKLIDEIDVLKLKSDVSGSPRYFLSYYNSWKYDYYDEPLVAIVNNLLGTLDIFTAYIEDEERLKRVRLDKFFNVVGKSACDIVQNFTGINLKSIIDEILELTCKYDKNADLQIVIEKLQEELRRITAHIPLVIIVDELDRCIPSYAIKVLERLHHIFDGVKNVVLIVVMDKSQLEHSIESIFGPKVDTDRYFKKFFDVTLRLDEGNLIDDWIAEYENQLFQQFKSHDSWFNYGEYYPEMVSFVKELLDTIEIRSREKILRKATIVTKLLKNDGTIMLNENIIAFLIMFLIVKDRYSANGSMDWMYNFIMASNLYRSEKIDSVLDGFRKLNSTDAKIMVKKDKFLGLIEKYRGLAFRLNNAGGVILDEMKLQISGVCLGLFVKIIRENEAVNKNIEMNYLAAKKIVEICEFLK